jgi:trans-aconitate 2-methyltransferase
LAISNGDAGDLARDRDVWDPDRYARFADERRAPFLDLLALVEPVAAPRVVDLGCGSGELTRLAHERLDARETVGLDRSEAMLARAAAHAVAGLRFAQGDLADAGDGPWDVILSNAALHWVPDHARLLARLAGLLAPGGQLAIQVPANEDHPSHAIAREVAREPEHAAALGGHVRESPVLAPEVYSQTLFALGLPRQRVRVEIYAHPLPGPEAVIDWVRGTLLTDYERRLSPEAYARFLARYRERLLAALPAERPFLYTYRRLFLWARR